MSKTIVFIHGAWMTPLCWDKFTEFFERKGYKCIAPAWPYKDRPIAEQRKNPDPNLAHLGITEIVDHYEKIIREQAEPPLLIGHSYGGLFVEMLLDRGVGAAGVAIDPAPPKGVFPFYPTVIRANMPVLMTIGGWRKVIDSSFEAFRYAFVHLLPPDEQRAIYDKYVVPETGRIFFQSAFAMFNNLTRVNYQNNQRGPLLIIAGAADQICPAVMNKANYNKYKNSSAKTDFKEFENRCHFIIGQPGWEVVANYAADWLAALPESQ
jgi:pimeloyl-ACP methyl ester carboxylesterase